MCLARCRPPSYDPGLVIRALSGPLLVAVMCGSTLPVGAQDADPPDAPEAGSGEPAADGGETEEGDAEDDGPPEGAGTLESPAGGRERARRLAVLILATRDVDPEIANALTEVVIGAVAARGGAAIIGKEEFQSQLGQGEARSMECVSSTACLGRVGVELSVDEVIAGTVGRRGPVWIFNINRIDIRSGELVGRAFREMDGDLGAVAAAIQESVPELYRAVSRPATLLVSTNVDGAEVFIDGMLIGVYRGEPVELPDVAPGRHEVAVSARGHFEWERAVRVAEGATLQIEATLEEVRGPEVDADISPLLWVGLGVALGAGGAAVAFGTLSQREPGPALTRADAISFADDRRRDANIANASLAVTAAGVALAVTGLLLSDFSGEVEPGRERRARLGAAPLAGGALLAVEGAL